MTVMVGGAPMYPTKNIVENAVNSKDHTTLVAAVKAAGLVDTLERDGFVKRVPDPKDRRMMSVVLTGKAQQFLRDLLPGHFQLMAALMRPLDEFWASLGSCIVRGDPKLL